MQSRHMYMGKTNMRDKHYYNVILYIYGLKQQVLLQCNLIHMRVETTFTIKMQSNTYVSRNNKYN